MDITKELLELIIELNKRAFEDGIKKGEQLAAEKCLSACPYWKTGNAPYIPPGTTWTYNPTTWSHTNTTEAKK
jgi:hypothetical protein